MNDVISVETSASFDEKSKAFHEKVNKNLLEYYTDAYHELKSLQVARSFSWFFIGFGTAFIVIHFL